nr:hypothetical protein [Tanacetum cinerariifolium]
MRELREDTFSGNINNNAHENIERVLDIVILFNIPRVTRDANMLRVFPITLTGAVKRWWHDGSPSQIVHSSSNSEGMASIISKLDNLGRVMKKLKENVHAIQVGCQLCDGPHLDKECPLNEDAKSVKEEDDDLLSEDLRASINILSKFMFEHLKIANLKETKMLIKMADMTKKAPLGIVENILVKFYKFLFSLDFVIINVDIKHYWESTNDKKQINITWDNLSANVWIKICYGKVFKITKDRILKAYWKERFGEEDDDTDEGWEDPKKCRENKINAILDTVLDKLDGSWFSGTTKDKDDLDEPTT